MILHHDPTSGIRILHKILNYRRVLKTIRLDMTELQSILESLPEQGNVNRLSIDDSYYDNHKHSDDAFDY